MRITESKPEPDAWRTIGHRVNGIWVPLVTPFRDGKVDLESLKRLSDHLLATGVRGFLACGTSGEGSLLTNEERTSVVETVVAVAGDCVMAGAFGRSAEELATAADAMRSAGARAIAVLPPPYVSLSAAELQEHFIEVASTSSLPVMLYNFPGHTPTAFDTDTVLRLAAHPNVIGLKQSGPVFDGEVARVICSVPPDFAVMIGNPQFLMAAAGIGGRGGIVAAAHLEAPRLTRVWALVEEGAWQEAQRLYRELFPSLFAVRGLGAQFKRLLYDQGLISSPELRSPLRSIYQAGGVGVANRSEGIR